MADFRVLFAILLISSTFGQWIMPIDENNIKYLMKFNHFNDSDSMHIETNVQVFNEGYSDNQNSPLLVYLALTPDDNVSSLKSLTKQLKGALVVLPTRFFGFEKQPKEFFSISNLQYLSVDQIIEDIRRFVELFKLSNHSLRISPFNPVILFGKDFLGSISYYSRIKYPYIFKAAIAQDPIIYSTGEFPEYDREIYKVFEAYDYRCTEKIQIMMHEIEQLLVQQIDATQPTLVKLKEDLLIHGNSHQVLENISNLLYQIADNQEEIVQFCINIKSATNIYAKVQVLNLISNNLSSSKQKAPISELQKRLRMWLDCQYFGLFPIADQNNNNIRSQLLDLLYFKEKCRKKFSQDISITFNFKDINKLNSQVWSLSNILLVSTNSIKMKAMKEHLSEIKTVYCEQCYDSLASSFVESQDSVQDEISQINYNIQQWMPIG